MGRIMQRPTVIVEDHDCMHRSERLKLCVQVGRKLAELVTRLLRLEVRSGSIVMPGRVDNDDWPRLRWVGGSWWAGGRAGGCAVGCMQAAGEG